MATSVVQRIAGTGVQLSTDVNGNITGLLAPDGSTIPIGSGNVTTLYAASQTGITTATEWPINFSASMIDENGTGDLVNDIIAIPPAAAHVKLSCWARFNNSGTTAGVQRKAEIQMSDATDTWMPVPGATADALYVAANTSDSTAAVSTPKIPLSYLEEAMTTSYGVAAVPTKFRMIVYHDNGANMGLTATGPGTYAASLSAEFF